MKNDLNALALRIKSDIDDLIIVVERIIGGWQRVLQTSDDYYLDGVALNLHGFYSGIEKVFVLIAENLDNSLPQGENWHQLLLQQMADEVPGIRPALISKNTLGVLNKYRGFRHVVRNVYTYQFDSAKVEKLVEEITEVYNQVSTEIIAFTDFLLKFNSD